jgi:hypothetical protein
MKATRNIVAFINSYASCYRSIPTLKAIANSIPFAMAGWQPIMEANYPTGRCLWRI